MIKTQVQIPDELYQRAKQIAKEREWSLAEVMRRGLEHMVLTHPPLQEAHSALPILPSGTFVEDFDELDLKALAEEDETSRSLKA
jgi:hypothetical protein